MKVTQGKAEFQPITILLETEEEAVKFANMLNTCSDNISVTLWQANYDLWTNLCNDE